jgi:hypothetical protein
MQQLTSEPYKPLNPRKKTDRRIRPFKSFFLSLYKGRRGIARRYHEAAQPFYTDIYETWVGLNVITIVCLSALDSFFTLQILERGGSEINPVMLALMQESNFAFITGKILITSVCLLFILIHINFKILRLVPMRSFLLLMVCFYGLLISYEISLLATI